MPNPADTTAKPTLFVLTSFDTTPKAEALTTSKFERFLAQVNATANASFTLFINTGFLQLKPGWKPPKGSKWETEDYTKWLGNPDMPKNQPCIPYAKDPDEILQRIAIMKALIAKGVEISSHTVRHAHGGKWTEETWEKEFADHERILKLAGLPMPKGLRAPFMETTPGMFRVMERHDMTYDTSKAVAGLALPKNVDGTKLLEVGVTTVNTRRAKGLFFNLNAKNNLKLSPKEYYEVAMEEFDKRYTGNHAPLLLSGHGSLYMDAIPRIMKEVCAKPDVRCGTLSEYTEYMREFQAAHPEPTGR